MVVVPEWENGVRLLLSAFLGGIIGYERQNRHKSAGLRTNILVCVGSCLIMIVSQRTGSQINANALADPSRIAAQVVSGIGFLGAGAILKEGVNIIGLTTAACIWVVAGVGLAVGIGYYSGAVITSVIVFIALKSLTYMDKLIKYHDNMIITITAQDESGQMARLYRCFLDNCISIRGMSVTELSHDMMKLRFIVYNENDLTNDEIIYRISKLKSVVSVEVS